jgi:hypothetical protein
LEEITKCSSLRCLDVSRTEITGRALTNITRLPRLEAIVMEDGQLDRGLDDTLTQLPRLRRIGIAQHTIDPRIFEQLRLPALHIVGLIPSNQASPDEQDDQLSSLPDAEVTRSFLARYPACTVLWKDPHSWNDCWDTIAWGATVSDSGSERSIRW